MDGEDETRGGRIFKLRHDDHWDTLDTSNNWTGEQNSDFPFDLTEWDVNCLKDEDDARSNDQLYEDPKAQSRLEQVLRIQSEHSLPQMPRNATKMDCIPLFKDDNGEEYQIGLTWSIALTHVKCPSNTAISTGRHAEALRQVYSRLPHNPSDPFPLPRFVFALGSLDIRTTARNIANGYPEDGETTEKTDYNVIMDAEGDDMSLWIVASRQALADRETEPEAEFSLPMLPIFQGLMHSEETGHFDSACILPSVRRLGKQSSEAPTAAEVYELVRKSRGVRYPVVSQLPKDQLQQWAEKKPLEPVPSSPELTNGSTASEQGPIGTRRIFESRPDPTIPANSQSLL